MRRYELTDMEWEMLEPLLPAQARTGRKRKPMREVMNGVFWVLRSGAPWRDMPERYGPWKTVYHHFNGWRKAGVLDGTLRALQVRLNEEGRIDWELWSIDGTTVRASRAAAGGGKKGGQKNRTTMP